MTALSSATSFGTAVSPPAADSGAPVSYVQEELWLLDRLSPQGTAHNRPMFVRITVSSGTLDVPALQRALDEIVRRHEVLRTAFPMTEGQPMQVVLPGAAVPLSIVDVSGAPGDPGRPGNPVASAVPGATVMSQATQEMDQHFDLEGGSLIRARLFRFGDRDHLLMIVVHEIAFDEPSADILLRELSALYTAFASGLPSPLPDLPLRYADFARLQRQDAEDGRLENSLAYWKQQLGGKIPSTDLPIGRRGQPGRALTAARQTIDLSPDLCRTLGALDRDDLFVTLVGCLTTLLNRYSGEDDTVIGSLWVNREHRGSERLIGNFSNTLVLRTRLAGDPTAREVCGRIREVIDGARAHSAIPFVKLLELARPERDGSMAPLSRVMFVLDAASPLVASAAGVTMRRDEVAIPTPKLDLTLRVSVGDQAIRASIDYYEELFDAPAISRVLEHYVNLLEAIVGHPDQPISTLPFLTKTERHVLLEDWGGRPSTASEFSGIHRAFEAWADRTPDAVALFVGTERLTYRELNQRANQLARHLRDLGVGPEVPVGICVGRSARMVEGILAILKAGGAYVPLDPAYPKDRLAFMVRDAGVPVLLLEQATAGSISGSPARSVFLDTDRAQISRLSDRNLEEPISAQSAAYIIYTSGSTGDPRGVVVTHANVCHYVEAVRVPMDLTSDDKYLHTASW